MIDLSQVYSHGESFNCLACKRSLCCDLKKGNILECPDCFSYRFSSAQYDPSDIRYHFSVDKVKGYKIIAISDEEKTTIGISYYSPGSIVLMHGANAKLMQGMYVSMSLFQNAEKLLLLG